MKNSSDIDAIYNASTIKISEMIGRTYNNPLGENVLDQIIKQSELNEKSNILDIGSGRGKSCLYINNKSGASCTGIEFSKDMYQASIDNVKSGKIKFINADFMNVDLENEKYDLIIGLDVFCYFESFEELTKKIFPLLKKNSSLVFTTYYCDSGNNTKVDHLCKSWGIQYPFTQNKYKNILTKTGFKTHTLKNTTKEYFAHWKEMRTKTIENKNEITNKCGDQLYLSYLQSVETILEAIQSNEYGHFLCISQKGDNK